MKISDEEYQALKEVLVLAYNEGRLMEYNREAAIYYAEWWLREYVGGIPSKEDVANGLGICDSEGLYKSARTALRGLKFRFISGNRIEYFRTMLSRVASLLIISRVVQTYPVIGDSWAFLCENYQLSITIGISVIQVLSKG